MKTETSLEDKSRAFHYGLIEQALYYLAEHHTRQPSLAELASHIGLSETYLQRLFSEWVGISPKRFLQFLSKEYIKTRLAERHSCLDAGLEAGLSGPGRLHELFVKTESITPAEYRRLGRSLQIQYGFHDSPFGEYLLGVTPRGVCHLAFVSGERDGVLAPFRDEWAEAELRENPAATTVWHERIFPARFAEQREPLHLLLKGTNFQIKVWEALLELAAGELCDYEGIAARIGQPQATRAAASAIARNHIGYLIPCHRVVRKIGESGEFRWGRQRKRLMLAWEAARREAGEEESSA